MSTWRPLTMIISIKAHLLYGKKGLHKRRGGGKKESVWMGEEKEEEKRGGVR